MNKKDESIYQKCLMITEREKIHLIYMHINWKMNPDGTLITKIMLNNNFGNIVLKLQK